MSALSATILSDVTIASTKASLAALDGLQQTILSAAEANPATIGSDEGVGSLYGFVRNARAKFADPDTADAKQQMPAPIIEVLTSKVVPALADVVSEFQALWTQVQVAVEAGGTGAPLVEEFLAKAEDESSALMRLQDGLVELDRLALSSAMDQLASVFS